MSELVVDSGIHTLRDLAGILPEDVRTRINGGGVLADSTGALRILATIKNPGWRVFVDAHRVDWAGMVGWALREFRSSDSVRVRVEAAASLDGSCDAEADLLYVARALDRENFLAVVDAMRIVADGGLEP